MSVRFGEERACAEKSTGSIAAAAPGGLRLDGSDAYNMPFRDSLNTLSLPRHIYYKLSVKETNFFYTPAVMSYPRILTLQVARPFIRHPPTSYHPFPNILRTTKSPSQTPLRMSSSSSSTTTTKATTTVPSTSPVCTLSSLDHLVLTVQSIPATIEFYTNILGMAHQSFTSPSDPTSTVRHALLFGSQKINLHQAGKEFEPKARTALPGTADLCFLTEEDVGTMLQRLGERGIEVLEGGQVVRRTGARSPLRSVYVRDPDGNLIEISNPTV